MRNKVYIAVCGLVDSGKSTFIKYATKYISSRDVNPDALCLEEQTGKTITNTKVSCPISHKSEIVFIDCPGHLEYVPEIVSGLCLADAVILIEDANRKNESQAYFNEIESIILKLNTPIIAKYTSHSDVYENSYDIDKESSLQKVCSNLLSRIDILLNEFNIIEFQKIDADRKLAFYSYAGIVLNNISLSEWKEVKWGLQEFNSSLRIKNKESSRFLICDSNDKSNILGILIINNL